MKKECSDKTLVIDKNIPLPDKRSVYKDIWDNMDVGDSFLVPPESKVTIRSSVYYANKKHSPKRFTIRTIESGVRIWRIE